MKLIEGKVVAKSGMKVGIVASRFNAFIVQKLLDGAVDGLVRHGVAEENISAALRFPSWRRKWRQAKSTTRSFASER